MLGHGVGIQIAALFKVLLLVLLLVAFLLRFGRLIATLTRDKFRVLLVACISAFVLARMEQARAGLCAGHN